MAQSSFVERKISVAVKLSQAGTNKPNTFANTGSDTVTLSGMRTSVRIQNSTGAAGSSAQVSIWGLSPTLMNQLSTLGMVVSQVPRDTITITAGDADSGMSTVFIGTIVSAYGDYNEAPKVPFRFECNAGAAENAIPFAASSYTGKTDVVTVLSAIASKMGWGFENNGVSVTLTNPYFPGTAMTQVQTIERQAHINAKLINNVLCVWPRYGSRNSPTSGIPLVSAETGMIGYPSFTQQGILIKTIFDQRIAFGSQIKVQSSIFTQEALARIDNATSTWQVYKLDLALDALVPRGDWMSMIYAFNPRFPAPIPQAAS